MLTNRFIQRSWSPLIGGTFRNPLMFAKQKSFGHQNRQLFWNIANNDDNKSIQNNLFSTINHRRFASSSSSSAPQESTENKPTDPNEDNQEQDDEPIVLMKFIPRGMPNLFNSLKNLYLINVVIRNQIDRNFKWQEFIRGAKQALIVVSSHLANNRLNELEGLVDDQALAEIRQNYEKLSIRQRRELQLLPTDIVLSFAHHIDIQTHKEEFTGSKKYIVSFFLVFDCIRNLEELLKEKAMKQQNISPKEMFKEFADRKVICNYEFSREYIEQQENQQKTCKAKGDWIITKLLHIKEKDVFKLKF